MKYVKRLLAVTLATLIAAGLLAPMPAEAATRIKGKIRFAYWTSATSCDLEIDQQNADRYQYKVYYNSKRLKRTSGKIALENYGDPFHTLQIKGLPKNSCSYVSVRIHKNGAWTRWSSKLLLIPDYEIRCIKPSTKYNNAKKTFTVSWKKITGITHYDLYIRTSATKWKKVKTFTKSDKTKYTFENFKGKAFKDNTTYYYMIIAKRKVSGSWKTSDPNKEKRATGDFGFNRIIME